jgi:hypothetical protein
MRQVLPMLFATLVASAAFAQSGAKPADKPAAKPAAKAPAQPSGNKGLARSAQKAVEEATPIDDDPNIKVSEADLEVAKQVYVGEMPCELGAKVNVRAARRTGLFVITTRGHRFLMHPVESRTGAIRLEDPRRGAMWLQLGNKSMLMSQKLGQRLADECQSPEQITFAEELKRNPRPSILEPMPHGGMHGGMQGGGMQGGMPCCAPGQPGAAAAPGPGGEPAATVAPAVPTQQPAPATPPADAGHAPHAAPGAAPAMPATPPADPPRTQ